MKESSLIIHDRYEFDNIKKFLDVVAKRKCIYYASDFLKANEDNLAMVDNLVQHTMEIFKTLGIPTEGHFYSVFRSGRGSIFKDWKLSGTACVYMLVNGDPTDLRTIAQQQTELIDFMLQHIHLPIEKYEAAIAR